MLCVPGWGCFPQEYSGFTEVECGHLRAAKLFSVHHCCLVPLLSPSKKRINNQKMRERWGMEGSRHLKVIRSMQCGKVNVSSCPCVYCCLHIDLFPDPWAMTWKEFRLQQILHRTSMWPLGLNKGKSITLLLWSPWQSHDGECWCCWPCAGQWHRRCSLVWSHHEGWVPGHPPCLHPARLPLGQGSAMWMEHQKTSSPLLGSVCPYFILGAMHLLW